MSHKGVGAPHGRDEGDLDEFLDELAGVDVDVKEEDLESWNELDDVEEVISVPESNRTSSAEGTPAASRADSPPATTATTQPTPPAWQPAALPAPAGPATTAALAAPRAGNTAPETVPMQQLPPGTAGTGVPAVRAASAGVSAPASRHPPPGSLAAAAAGPAARTALTSSAGATAAQATPSAAAPRPTVGPPASRARTAAAQPAAVEPRAAAAPAAARPAAAERASASTRTSATATAAAPLPATGSQPAGRPAAAGPAAARAAAGAQSGRSAGAGKPQPEGPAAAGRTARERTQEIEQQQAEPSEPPQAVPSGGGWGGWGAFGKLGATLTAAAANAVKDVSELTESFQQVLQDIANASDEEEEAVPPANAAAAPAQALPPGPAALVPAPAGVPASRALPAAAGSAAGEGFAARKGSAATGADAAAQRATEEEEARRRQILSRLESFEEDTKLGRTVKVMDRQVEQLSAGAGKALSSLWGWGATLAQRVEQAASSAAKELAETVGEAGLLGGGLQGPGASQLGSKDEALSFDQCFYIYGGQQAFEELEALSNECARLCNRLRSKLPDDDKANLDKVLALLVPLFELGAEHPAEHSAAGAAGQGQGGGEAQQVQQQPVEPVALARGHAMIADLAAAGCARADAMAQSASQRAEELVATPPQEPSAAAGQAEEGAQTEAEAAPLQEKAAAAGPQGAPQQQEPSQLAVKALKSIQSEGVKRIAEVGSLCIERLLALARSVAAQFRFGRPADDGVAWPPSPEAKALLLRGQARRMLGDVEAVAQAFTSALLRTGRSLDLHSSSKVFGKLSNSMQTEVTATAAGGRVHDAFKALMYVVWLSCIDRELLE